MIKFLDLQKINQNYEAEIKEAVNKTIHSGWYLNGDANRKFERELSQYIGSKYSITRKWIGCFENYIKSIHRIGF